MIEQEIAALVEEIKNLDDRVRVFDAELKPVTTLEFEIRDRIRRTHGGRPGIDPIVFNREGALARRPLFDRLMDIAVSHGPVKARRSELRSRLKAYQKRVEALRTELERERKRAKKKPLSDAKTADQGEADSMAMRKQKLPPPSKYEILGRLLFSYGLGSSSTEDFWREMKSRGYGQDDIDWWCDESRAQEDAKAAFNPYAERRR